MHSINKKNNNNHYKITCQKKNVFVASCDYVVELWSRNEDNIYKLAIDMERPMPEQSGCAITYAPHSAYYSYFV
jgi:hypothetical protein